MLRVYLLIAILYLNIFANEKVSLQLLWLDQFQFAGYYIAKEKGFYTEANLDVEIKKFNENISVVDEVLNGKSDYGIGRINLIIEKLNGKDIVAMAAIYQSSPLILLSLKSSNINSIEDLKNKKIMFTGSNNDASIIYTMLASNGITSQNSTFQKLSTNFNELIEGKTDSILAYISNEPYILEEKGLTYKYFSPQNYGFDYYSDILFTSKKILTKNPITTQKFLEASLKGWEYAFNNIDESVDIIFKNYNSQKKTKEALLFEAKKLKELAYYNNAKIGNINIAKVEKTYEMYKILGKVKGNIDINDFLYSQYKLNLTDEEKKFITNNKVLKVGTEKDYAPYNFNEEGIQKGFSIDYINLLAKKVGFEIDYNNNASENENINLIKNKNIDLILDIVETPNIKDFMNFSTEYLDSILSIFISDTKKNILTLSNLEGKTVAIPKDSSLYEIIKKHYPNIKIELTTNTLESLEKVAFGKVDATIANFTVANHLIEQYGLTNIKAITRVHDKIFNNNSKIGIRKDLPILKNILEKGMLQIEDEELIDLRKKWLSNKHNSSYSNLSFSKSEKDFILNQKEIRICIDPNWAPYEFLDNNTFVGLTAEYMKHFSDLLNTPINLVTTSSFEESLAYIKSKKCDILPAVTITVDRLNYMNFTKPYLVVDYYLATKKDTIFPIKGKDISGKTIGFVKNYSGIDLFKQKYPPIIIKEYKSIQDGLLALTKGEIYGFIDNDLTMKYISQKRHMHDIEISTKLDEQWELSVGIRDDSPILLSIFQKLITSLSQADKENINNKLFYIKFEDEINYSFFAKILVFIIVFIIFTFLYLWNTRLKNELNRRRILEKKLNSSISDFKILVNSTIEAILIINKDGYCIEVNTEAEKLLLFDKSDDYLGKHILFIISESDKENVSNKLKEEKAFPEQITLIKKDGTSFPALVKGENINRLEDKIRIVSIVDLTELKRNEHLLFQQSKMALLGEMMSAIAHQWRQPLNALGVLNMQIETKLEFNDSITKEEYEPICKNINKQLSYMSKTIDDFRDFFIPTKNKVKFNLCKIINEVYEILKPQLLNKNIKFNFMCHESLINGYPNEFKQVIINIINNAKEAILINNIKNGEINVSITQIDNNIQIIISDNGGGIKDEIIAKIFNPYFTTKFESKGTGIGLYMSKMIIEKSMHGSLDVKSEDNKTFFRINLSTT